MSRSQPARDRAQERTRVRAWMDAFDDELARSGPEAVERIMRHLRQRAALGGLDLPYCFDTPYVNTIAVSDEPPYPGDLALEQRIEALTRWNAMAMVVRANRRLSGIGGHISTYASAATLFEVGFHHFFRGKDHPDGPDQVLLQGHASPGVYARAFLEGRLSETHLENFRRELQPGGGLSSYPHPWLMPSFWELPSVSMGLSPIMAIYQARFNRYLLQRGLVEKLSRVWAVVGDGEMDEPESSGALHLAAWERLDNLCLIVNCNLQRLDGPVRGSGKVVRDLESLFRGAGWNVIKVLWGSNWDPLFEDDTDGRLAERLEEVPDGEMQRFSAQGGQAMREGLFGDDPELAKRVEHLSDTEIADLKRGGHDPKKVFAAYRAAEQTHDRPTVVLAQTVKGYGLGEQGEARNITHKTKKLDVDGLRAFRDRFDLPIPDDRVGDAPFYRPADDSPEIQYLLERRKAMGGLVPRRKVRAAPFEPAPDEAFAPYLEAQEREATTTVLTVRLLADLLKTKNLGELIVPIVPDEARTFGVEALFPQVAIHAPVEQRYEPVDAHTLLAYKEAKTGQILEEGITEAGSAASTIAAGTAYAAHGVNTIPFFFFYSMFGFQRVGDLLWAAGDARARGFLVGATSGRTTLNGEGLQHEDGHSHLVAMTHPTVRAYDPAFGFELAVIVQDGIRRMLGRGEPLLYYLTVANEPHEHPAMPEGVREGILRGMYRYRASRKSGEVRRVQLLASGTIVHQALRAQRVLEDYGVTADVWSVTSWKALYEDAIQTERYNRLHPGQEPRQPYVRRCLGEDPGTVVAVSDHLKALGNLLGRWVPELDTLGTDGFGRSDSREALRSFFEVDDRHIVAAALSSLARAGRYPLGRTLEAFDAMGIDPEKLDALRA